ncbi:Lsd1/2 complex PHD finger containing protein Phf2 [Desmophyllum pertusum]|uniref:Lsd1/2 complex PHD finger containing protein Phf2 n=1 Tax=Desmophyllum pertusum TaxID=174260 RepID=A0A9W9ZD35_9CNID|nr:Lsd1/2 complex PHD finger containing protein Phf2 [Desmophyllum pertusum]
MSVSKRNNMADTLYCICRRPYDSSQFMIQCDSCEEWYHGSCVGIEEFQSSDIERYHCPDCALLHGPLTLKKRRNWHRHDYSEIDDGSKAVQAGTVAFIKELKTRKFKDNNVILKLENGKDLTTETFETHGFNRPMLIVNKEGLGMVIPDKRFTVMDVERHVGPMRELDVIDVCRQEDHRMRMREWTEYYNSPVKKKILNVISLEFSTTSLSQLVHAPAIVREMDWASHVWPTDLPEDCPHKKPLIQKYCLMGVKNSYTDFHVDFGGTSVWYHVVKGEKVFYFVDPTEENFKQYEKWVSSVRQSEVFFGDMVKNCYKCVVKPGQTMFIPTGWIHAVFTPVDSLVFGGNFLCTFNTELQLRVYKLERQLKTPDKFLHPCFETINWYAAVYLLDKLKAFLESGRKAPNSLVQCLNTLVVELKLWSTRGEGFTKLHKFFIPDSISPAKLIKSMAKELKKTEKSGKSSRPSTPKIDENNQRESGSPVASVVVDGALPRLKIKAPKPDNYNASSPKHAGERLKCELDDSKPVIRIANTVGLDLKRTADPLSASLPSLKLKIPRTQEPLAPDMEMNGSKMQLSTSADSSLKLVVSNGKIISNNNRNGRKITGKKFQPLMSQDMTERSDVTDGSYSCSPSKQGPLRLKLSMNSMSNKNASFFPTNSTESNSDTSDNELNFSLGGTPSLIPVPSRTTQGSMGTTFGLQATGSDPRTQQPVAGLDWTSSADLKEEIEAAKTLLFGLSAGGGVNARGSSSFQSIPLNSDRAGSESHSEGGDSEEEEDLGFGDSNYFHDNKYVYPPLAQMTDEPDNSSSWKPGQRKKKSEKVDSTWNPKSKLLYSPSREYRPVRQTSRRNTGGSTAGSLLNSPLEESAPAGVFTSGGGTKGSDRGSSSGSNATALNGSEPGQVSDSTPSGAKLDSNAKAPGKRGRQKTVTTTKQRLAKILKLDKSGRYMR